MSQGPSDPRINTMLKLSMKMNINTYVRRGLLLAVAAMAAVGSAMPAYAAPRVITKAEKKSIKQAEKEKKNNLKDQKKLVKEGKKRAAVVKKELAKITPIPVPEVAVDEAERENLEKAAEGGSTSAMVRLGHYHMQHESPGYIKKAGEYFRKASEAGSADGIVWYALHQYITQPGEEEVAKQKCYEELKKAAAEESLIGMYLAGVMAKDKDEKAELFDKAAHAGFVPAMRMVGKRLVDEARGTPETRHNPMPDDAIQWFEFAYRFGDDGAAIERSDTTSMHRGLNLPETDTALAEKWLRNALELALKRENAWFGSAFDSDYLSRNPYAWGSARMMRLLVIYSRLARVRKFDGKSPADALRECCNTIKKMASEGQVDAMATAVMLSRKWSFWMSDGPNPGILKEGDWIPKIKELAAGGNKQAARLIKEFNKLGK